MGCVKNYEYYKLVLGACSTNVYIVSSNKKNAILIDPADNAAVNY